MQTRAPAAAARTRTPPCSRTRCSALAAALLAVASVARADPLASVELRWKGPASCPELGEVSAEARRLLPADGAYEPTRIDITLTERADAPGYRLQFWARSASRSADRELLLSTCDEARQASALLVALTLDPEAVAKSEPEPPAPTPAPAPAAAPASTPAAAPASTPAPASARAQPASIPTPSPPSAASFRLAAELTAGAIGDSAVLPAFAVGPFAAVGVRASSLRLALAGLYLPGAAGEIDDSDDGSVRSTLLAAQLEACPLWRLSRAFEIGPCVSGELGRYAARSVGVTHTRDDAALWAAAGAGFSAAVAVAGKISLVAACSALIPLRRPVLSLSDSGPAYIVPQLSIRAVLGVRWNSNRL